MSKGKRKRRLRQGRMQLDGPSAANVQMADTSMAIEQHSTAEATGTTATFTSGAAEVPSSKIKNTPSRGQKRRHQKKRKSMKLEKALAVASRLEKKAAVREVSRLTKSQSKSLWNNENKK